MVKFGDMTGPLAVALMLIEGARKALGIIDVSDVRVHAHTHVWIDRGGMVWDVRMPT